MNTETTRASTDATSPTIEDRVDDGIDDIGARIEAARRDLDAVLGTNPWVRLGVSTAVGFAVGLAGGRVLRSGLRFALALGARRLVRHAFEAAFDVGQAHAARADARSAY